MLKYTKVLLSMVLFVAALFSISNYCIVSARSEKRADFVLEKKLLKTDQLDLTFPQVQKMADKQLESKINMLIVDKVFEIKRNSGIAEQDLPKTSFYANYHPPFVEENLLSLRFDTMYYVQGTAHPTNLVNSITIDTLTGTTVSLADLFKHNVNYKNRLNEWMNRDLHERELTVSEPFKGVEENQGFYLTENRLCLYFNQYTPHAVGPLVFSIPYIKINDLMKVRLL